MGEAITRWDNTEKDGGLLLFKQGELLKLTSMPVQGFSLYYRAYAHGEEGLVSGTIIDIHPYSWYWAGNISRSEAEFQLLQSQDKKFLIREISPWNYYLSYKIQKSVYHFKIMTKDTHHLERTFLFITGPRGLEEFNTISDLAWFVQKKSGYASLWWKPCDDEVNYVEIRSRKYRGYTANR